MSSPVENEVFEEMKAATLSMLSDDFVGVWQIPWAVARLHPGMAENLVRTLTLRVVEDLMTARMMRAGRLIESGRRFVDVGLSAKQVTELIAAEWDRLGRPPNVGEVIWFAPVD